MEMNNIDTLDIKELLNKVGWIAYKAGMTSPDDENKDNYYKQSEISIKRAEQALNLYIEEKVKIEILLAKTEYAAELSVLDQEIISLKAKLARKEKVEQFTDQFINKYEKALKRLADK